jgi:hypothetical protein
MQVYFIVPANICRPAIPKIKWKNKITILASASRGKADASAETITLRPSTEEIVLRGLMTLNDLRDWRLVPPPALMYPKYPVVTIVISSKFQASRI